MILLYLEVGKFLYELIEKGSYGDKITTKAANFMKINYPEIKGFTKRNIERMVQFYKTYKDDEIATPLVTQLSWTNNLLILSGSKSTQERHFYLQLSIKENYSKRELSCLVAFELKLGEFKAEYLGKMNLYLEALDRDVKRKVINL